MLGKNFSRRHFKIFFLNFLINFSGFNISCKVSPCMKCQSLFSGKNEKNIIYLSSAEFDHRWVMVKLCYYPIQTLVFPLANSFHDRFNIVFSSISQFLHFSHQWYAIHNCLWNPHSFYFLFKFYDLFIVFYLTFKTLWLNLADNKLLIFFFPRKQDLTFHANCLHEKVCMKCQILFSWKK